MSTSASSIEQVTIDTIRTLSMDAVQAANSGHPGTPMALAPVAYSMFADQMKYDPANPGWFARDRFVLSCGHASMLLYSVLHLAGVKKTDADGKPTGDLAITLDDIRNFRQLHRPTAGHPEFGYAAGIETTTGPLGQGLGNSVGMAIAGKWLAATYNRPEFDMFGFDTYVICSDGDIMEGIGCEAASLAGHLKLSNLCWVYDDNKITIEGRTDLAFSEDVAGRFEALGWQVITVADANDLSTLGVAFNRFKETTDKPTLIIVKSIIGFGAPNKQDTSGAHGSPLGEEEISLAKASYGWEHEKFHVPAEVTEQFATTLGQRGAEAFETWTEAMGRYRDAHPDQAAELDLIQSGKLPENWETCLPTFDTDAKGMATRASSGKVLNAVAGAIPFLIGGSADLAGSNKSLINDEAAGHFSAEDYSGRNFHFGIREHVMASIGNGMSLCGIRPYVATFFVFTDYLRPSLRLSSVMHQPVLYIMTHDSIGLGEDGPTHQPVEHLAACRAIPNVLMMRPADANEVAQCYAVAMNETERPSVLVLSRQDLPTIDNPGVEGTRKGAYVVKDADDAKVILMGTGSELSICLEAQAKLAAEGIPARVVSVPCWRLFDEQSDEYRESVLPNGLAKRIAVEAGIQMGWDKYLGPEGAFVGMNSFGASAPAEELYAHFGITSDAVFQKAKEMVG